MTPGYDPANPSRGEREGETGRLGPHPPRIDQGGPPASFGRPPGYQQTSAFPSPPPPSGPPAAPVTSAYPGPTSGYPAPARPRRNHVADVALGLVVLLLVVSGVQAYLLYRTRHDLTETRRQAAAERTQTAAKAQGTEARIKELERRAGNTLDAAAVASDVLPSVFRVVAGQFTGTGFAFAEEASDGGTQLLTNFHVVEQVYDRGGREVNLEQQNRRFTARIAKVDQGADLALLVVAEKFPRLQPAPEPARPGQAVVVVGSPLGLTDSVTSGVVSALRDVRGGQVLQFDAPVNPGNSGGPIVNAQKQVVGIVNAKLDKAEGISLGIPVSVACKTLSLC